jgi:hypothetical protein
MIHIGAAERVTVGSASGVGQQDLGSSLIIWLR